MKKLLMLMLMILAVSTANSQTYYYQSKQFAYKYKVNGMWRDWTDWENCNVRISLNLDSDVITIYSAEIQTYYVYEYVKTYTDSSGGTQLQYNVIDQDGDYGCIRLRMESNKNSQLYVEFSDIIWVYSGLFKY